MSNIKLPKESKLMTEKDWFEFRNTIDPDFLGFNEEIEGSLDNSLSYLTPTKISGIISGDINIQNNLTTRNYTNGSGTNRIKYIVIHYTANNGDTAYGNTQYFKSEYRGASAHYFVDENYIYRCVEDKNISWHCGGGLQGQNGHTYYKICTNSNSIGIEMCSKKYSNGTYYFKEETIKNCINLVKYLMNKYNLSSDRVIRHFDVTGKICPAPFVNDPSQWTNFKNKLNSNVNIEKNKGIYKIVNCDELNVRKGNSTNYDKIGSLKVNTQVKVKEFDSGWGKIDYNGQDGWICGDYLEYISEINEHWCQTFLDSLYNKGDITDKEQWSKFDEPINKCLVLALLDKMTGGNWKSNEANPSIHWCQPIVISLCGKGIINDKDQWISTLDNKISKALLLALICNLTGGISDLYKNRVPDHWARNCLDTLCDRGIIQTPTAWINFEGEVNKADTMALLYKTIYK